MGDSIPGGRKLQAPGSKGAAMRGRGARRPEGGTQLGPRAAQAPGTKGASVGFQWTRGAGLNPHHQQQGPPASGTGVLGQGGTGSKGAALQWTRGLNPHQHQQALASGTGVSTLEPGAMPVSTPATPSTPVSDSLHVHLRSLSAELNALLISGDGGRIQTNGKRIAMMLHDLSLKLEHDSAPDSSSSTATQLESTGGGPSFKRDYIVKQVIGEGQSGRVYHCERRVDSRSVAIKKIRVVRGSSEQDVAKFLKEGTVLASLQHENIVRYFSSWKEEKESGPGSPKIFLEMEFCDCSLQDLFDRGVAPPKNTFLQIVRAVEYIHSQNLLHRDIAPHNILIAGGVVKLGDFGLAKHLASMVDTDKWKKGRSLYYSPDNRKNSQQTDMYALGVILFQIQWPDCTKDTTGEMIRDARDGVLPPEMHVKKPWATERILKLVSAKRELRPTAESIVSDANYWSCVY